MLPVILIAVPLIAQVQISRQSDRVAVTIDGRESTSFYYGPQVTKPYLWPLRCASGTELTIWAISSSVLFLPPWMVRRTMRSLPVSGSGPKATRILRSRGDLSPSDLVIGGTWPSVVTSWDFSGIGTRRESGD